MPRAVTLAFACLPAAALAFVLVLGATARFSAPNLPLPDLDTPGYLSPALSLLSGDGFQQAGGRDWLYPALLALILKATGSFPAIAAGQKLLGLFTVLLLAATWYLWVSFLNLDLLGRTLALLAGFVPAYFQACNSLMLFFDLRIRPEAVLSFFVFAQLFCLLAYVRFRWRDPRPAASLVFGVVAVLLAAANCLLKPSWLFAFLVTVLPVLLGLRGALSHRERWLTPVAGGLAALFLLWLPGKLFYKPDRASVTFLPSTLLTVHARMIKDTLTRQEARLAEADPRKVRLQKILAVFNQEFPIAESRPGTYESMGFDPDYLFYKSPLMPAVFENSGGTDASLRAFCFRAYFDTAVDQPVAMTRKVWTQFSYFLFPDFNSFYRSRIDLGSACRTGTETLAPMLPTVHGPGAALLQSLADHLAAGGSSAPRLTSHALARLIADAASSLSLVLPVLFLIALCGTHFWTPLHRFRFGGWVALLLYATPAANALTIAVVHALDNSRYRQSYSTFVVFALTALAVFFSTVVVSWAISSRKSFRSAPLCAEKPQNAV